MVRSSANKMTTCLVGLMAGVEIRNSIISLEVWMPIEFWLSTIKRSGLLVRARLRVLESCLIRLFLFLELVR